MDKGTLSKMWIYAGSNAHGVTDAMEFLLTKLKESKSNDDFFDAMNS